MYERMLRKERDESMTKYVNFQSNEEIERSNERIIIIIEEYSAFSFSNQTLTLVVGGRRVKSPWKLFKIRSA